MVIINFTDTVWLVPSVVTILRSLLLGRISLMRPIVTDGVAWSVCLSVGRSVCHNLEPCKNGRTDRDTAWNVDSGEPKEGTMY